MTDNRTTELPRPQLHRLLEKHDVDYWCAQQATFWNGESGSEFIAYQYQVDDVYKLAFKGVNVTPEQAIAATLGNERGTCHAESDLSEWVCSNCQCWIPLGLTPENIKHASEWRYCPHCGARVEVGGDELF